MSENIIPEKIQEIVSDVDEKDAGAVQDLSGKSLAELSDLFVKTRSSEGAMSRSKELEAIKSAFYKLLSKLKGESDGESRAENDPFEVVEQNFKAIYSDYKRERAEYMSRLEAEREESLKKKKAIIEELKALVEGQEDVSSQFTVFRELQNRWREAGPVPVQSYRDINDTYQYYVEKFYDMVKINRDLRDLDFKKNLEAKEAFCAAAEKLAENENVVNAFHELQKLHEQWKEYGPVAKEKREEIWDRFKAATSVINKKYQAHFEGLKAQQEDNLEKKKTEVMNIALSICEQRDYLESLQRLCRELSESEDESRTKELLAELDANIKNRLSYERDVDTSYFYAQAESLHEDFNAKLTEAFPSLTPQERRLATLLRLGFSSKYIATLMNITPKSVEISRYRLRQKLGLGKGDNLVTYIQSI